jgi:DNA recombination protein RmuC
MEILILLTIGLLGAAVGLLLGRYALPVTPSADPSALSAAQMEAARVTQECEISRSRIETLERERKIFAEAAKAAAEELARLAERTTHLNEQLTERGSHSRELESQRLADAAELARLGAEVARRQERETGLASKIDEQTSHHIADQKRLAALEAQRDGAAAEAKDLAAEVAALKERESSLVAKVGEQTVQLTEMQQKLTIEFENIANRVLRATSTELSEDSRKAIASVLDPLRERIQEFQGKVESTYDAEKREVLSLRDQIRQLVESSNTIGHQADGLAKVLRGDSQRIGRWGELALERILESAGLTEGREYISQGRGLGLKSEDGGVQRPDIIVNLPEQRAIIIDSKVPLTAYERLIAAEDKDDEEACRIQYVRDVKAHIDDLSSKRYQESDKLQAHEYALMFIPIESALAEALRADPELFTYGWDRRVVLVGPPTLLMTMRTVASIWRFEAQGQNAQEIARLAGDLCDKVNLSLSDLQTAADKIGTALSSHNEAVKRLSTGKGNALSIGDRIRSLGVKTRRPTPALLVDGMPLQRELDSLRATDDLAYLEGEPLQQDISANDGRSSNNTLTDP